MRDAFTRNERTAATLGCAVLVIASLLDAPITIAAAAWVIGVGIAAVLRMRSPGDRSLLTTGIDTILMHVIIAGGAYGIVAGVMTLLGSQIDADAGRGFTVAPCVDAMRLVWTRNARLFPPKRNEGRQELEQKTPTPA